MAEKRKGLRVAGAYTGDRVPKFTRWFYPFTGIFRDACYTLVGSFLLQYTIQTGVLSSDPTEFAAQYGVITIAMMIALIWDGINDPIMGLIVEKVHFKLGKYKPWILIGALGNALAVVLMFMIRPGHMDGNVWVANGWAYVGCMIAFYILWDTFFTMNDIGYWAMLPSLTNDENERAHLTSRVTICAAIGAFIMTLGATFLPTLFGTSTGTGAGTVYGIMAIAVSILFLVSQAAVFFFCQEKQRDLEQEEQSEKTGFLDLFKIIGKNGEVRAAVIGIFMYQLASTLITGGVGLNYFYLAIGYGSNAGGLVVSLISIFYVFAMLGSQALYPVIAKKFSKRKILLAGFIIALVGALGFFFTCFPVFGDTILSTSMSETPRSYASTMDLGWAFGGMMFCNYLFPFVFFFGCGLIYMVILVMFQDSIDYNEWKFHDRKESIISAWRPLDVKLAGAALRGIQYVVFISAGVLGYIDQISTAEGSFNSKSMAPEVFTSKVDGIVASIQPSSLRIIGIWVIVLFVICLGVMYYFLRFQYKTTEEEHRKIVAELAERHAAALVEFGPAEVGEEEPVQEKADGDSPKQE